jgi:hypothetical protein
MGDNLLLYTFRESNQWRYGFGSLFLGEQGCQMRTFSRTSVLLENKFRGSISKVMANDSLGISSSYDATMLLWDLDKKKQC